MYLRAALVLTLMTAAKLATYLFLVGARTPAVVDLFAVGDGIAVVAASIWIALGSPTPGATADLWRAPRTPGLLLLVFGFENVAFQVPMADAIAREANGAAWATIARFVDHATIGGLLGAVSLWLVVALGVGLVLAHTVGQTTRTRPRHGRRAMAYGR